MLTTPFSLAHAFTVGTNWSCIAVVLSVSPKDIHNATISPLLQLPNWKTYYFFFSPSFDKLPTLPMSQEDVKIEDRWQKIIVGKTVLITEGR